MCIFRVMQLWEFLETCTVNFCLLLIPALLAGREKIYIPSKLGRHTAAIFYWSHCAYSHSVGRHITRYEFRWLFWCTLVGPGHFSGMRETIKQATQKYITANESHHQICACAKKRPFWAPFLSLLLGRARIKKFCIQKQKKGELPFLSDFRRLPSSILFFSHLETIRQACDPEKEANFHSFLRSYFWLNFHFGVILWNS